MKLIDDLLKKIPDSVLNTIGLLSGLITIISVLPIALNAILMIRNGSFSFLKISGLRVGFAFLLLFCLWLLYKVFKYRKIQAETREVFSKGYYDLLRNYRNAIGEIKVAQKNNKESYDLTKKFIEQALNILCDIFSKLTRQTVSSCVKIIEPEEGKLDYSNARVYTFCRSDNSDPERVAYDAERRQRNVLICDNTDFSKIVEPGKRCLSCFYVPDLIEYQENLRKIGEEYNNSNSNWSNFYKSTIVVPIRIANEKNPKNDLVDSYSIIGFLCVDSKSTHAFDESQKAFYKSIVKAFAALLYSILDLYKTQISTKSD